MTNKLKDWKVIHVHCDLNERFGIHNDPKPICKKVFRFADKQAAINKFAESYRVFNGTCYNREVHSNASYKFYYVESGKEILTYLLLHFRNIPFEELTVDELK